VKDGSAVNVGLSRDYSILETAETIFSILNWRPQAIQFEMDRPVGAAKRCASTEKLKSITGWEPSISLQNGLEKTIEWYLANRWDKVRQLDHKQLLTEK
jgi:nucleoside-diphosphate-sugar epimerase